MKKDNIETTEDGKFWEAIRKDLKDMAECEVSDAFLDILKTKIDSMGPTQLKALYTSIYHK